MMKTVSRRRMNLLAFISLLACSVPRVHAATQAVKSFTLFTGDTNTAVAGYSPIANNATIDLATLPTRLLNIRADTASTVGSVRFVLDGKSNYHTESYAPYMSQGDVGVDYAAWTPSVGTHTISATPFTGAGATGTAGTSLTVTFKVVDGGGGQKVASLSLFTGDTNQPINGFNPISNGATIDLAQLPTRQLNIAANPSPATVGSIRFGLDGNANYHTETYSPYMLQGDVGVDYVSWTPTVGTHTVTATPFTGASGGGTAGTSLTTGFTVVDSGSSGDAYLHVVIDAPAYAVDYDGNGSEPVLLNGHDSHTHEPGRAIVSWDWTEGANLLGTTADITPNLSLGDHVLTLTIGDDSSPAKTLAEDVTFSIYPAASVGGALTNYYPTTSAALATLIDSLPATPGYVAVSPSLKVNNVTGSIGDSPYSANTVVTMLGNLSLATAGSYQFTLSGGTQRRFFVDGGLVSSAVSLGAGVHRVEARFAIDSTSSLPGQVLMSLNGGAASLLTKPALTHNESALKPFINKMTPSGSPLGGNSVSIDGVGFFPASGVKVHWGAATFTPPAISVGQTSISFQSPAGTGSVLVTVETPNGTSNSATFSYVAGTVPISFNTKTVTNPAGPTQAAWGPDGRLYVAEHSGKVDIYTFGDDYTVTNTQSIATLTGLANNNILGIAFNPLDPPSPVKVYLAHANLFANGGSCFTGTSAYSGQVSVLTGPNFSTIQPLITGLPCSNHDHGVNGLQFDNYGDLWISMGGNTNAGVPACNIGNLPDSPLTGAVLRARLSKAGFNGTIRHLETATGVQNTDQVAGDRVDVAPGIDVSVFSAGVRNGFDIVWTTRGKLYGTDNGPNFTFGPASTSATTQSPDPEEDDKINLLVEGQYYGGANRNRGRYDSRQNIWRSVTVAPIPGTYSAPLVTLPSSVDGLDEYRATTFNNQMRGNLLAQKWNDRLYNIVLTSDGRGVQTVDTSIAGTYGLDVVTGPGGSILDIDYTGNAVKVLQPVDAAAKGMTAYDIFPWRARPDGTATFTIGGVGFGNLTNTFVSFGGVQAALTSVTPTRIKGTIPARSSADSQWLNLSVQSNGQSSTIIKAFRYVLPLGTGKGAWETGTALPLQLGEVAAGGINGVIYEVGEGSTATLAYDLKLGTWRSNLAVRPYPGNHHSAEVINGKLYLFGGLGSSSEGKVQIYNPATNGWTTGASIPFAAGSVNTALINGKVYVAGGIVGSTTVGQAAIYEPTTNTWSAMASMPLGCNHAAAGTDGKLMYVFGGRDGGNTPSIGFDNVQIYNPATNSWQSSTPVLPQKRGGMGKAAYFNGEFYVMGGETTSSGAGQVAGNVYNRVDVYNPLTNSWRLETALPTARHGIYPVAYDGKIFVAGGGVQAAYSTSSVVEIFTR